MKAIFFETLEYAPMDGTYRQENVLFPEKDGMWIIINWPHYQIFKGHKIESFQRKNPEIDEDVQFFLIEERDVPDEIVEKIYNLHFQKDSLSKLIANLMLVFYDARMPK